VEQLALAFADGVSATHNQPPEPFDPYRWAQRRRRREIADMVGDLADLDGAGLLEREISQTACDYPRWERETPP